MEAGGHPADLRDVVAMLTRADAGSFAEAAKRMWRPLLTEAELEAIGRVVERFSQPPSGAAAALAASEEIMGKPPGEVSGYDVAVATMALYALADAGLHEWLRWVMSQLNQEVH